MNLPKSLGVGILTAIIGGLAYLLFSFVQSFESVALGMGGFISIEFGISWLIGSMVAGFVVGFLWSLSWSRISGDRN